MSRASASPDSHPAYRLALFDRDFLLSPAMRGTRLLVEFTKAEEALKTAGIASTLVVFGGSAVREDGPGRHPFWYAEARRFGRLASEHGGALRPRGGQRSHVIATGGGPGIMEAASRGAHDAGAPAIGFNIRLPEPQPPNRFTTPALTFQFHYFAVRKMHLALRARAMVVFPGGFGTLDELFELLTLRQTGRIRPMPIVLVDAAHWRRVIRWEALAEAGLLARRDLSLVTFAEDGAAAWAALAAAGLGQA